MNIQIIMMKIFLKNKSNKLFYKIINISFVFYFINLTESIGWKH